MKFLLYLIIFTLLFIGYVQFLRTRAVFFPKSEIIFTPREAGFVFEDIYFLSEDGKKLHGWFILCPDAKRTVLFLHGNGGNISHRIDKIGILHKAGVNVFIIDWRGYGRSEGSPSEQGIYRDAQAAYDFLITRKNAPPRQIILYGESLGGSVAVDLASRREVGGVILEGAFSSGQDMARVIYPWLPGFFVRNSYDSLHKIQTVKAPLIFLHSRDDEIVPYRLARKLFEAAPGKKAFIDLDGGHNTLFFDSGERYRKAIRDFIAGLG